MRVSAVIWLSISLLERNSAETQMITPAPFGFSFGSNTSIVRATPFLRP